MVFIASLLTACTAVDVTQLQPKVSPDIKAECGVPPAPGSTEARAMNPNAIANAIARAEKRLPTELRDDKVVAAIFSLSLNTTALTTTQVNDVPLDISTLPSTNYNLTYDDLKQFSNTVSSTYLKPTATSLPSEKNTGTTSSDPFDIYFRNYFAGTFYDRYGVNVSKPSLSLNINDAEINGALTMIIEYLLDSVDQTTPVFGDASTPPAPDGDTVPEPSGTVTFYPGAVKYQPTAYAAGLAKYVYAPPDAPCGITIEKVKFMGEVAKAAGASGNLISGLSVGSFGGLGFSLFGFIKFSFGDNKTLSNAAQTLASRLAMRAAYDAMYPIVLHVKAIPKITISNGVITASGN
jgi:hypothetical protein